jgi:hypothetical protein
MLFSETEDAVSCGKPRNPGGPVARESGLCEPMKRSIFLPLLCGAFAETFGKQRDRKSVQAHPFALGALGQSAM